MFNICLIRISLKIQVVYCCVHIYKTTINHLAFDVEKIKYIVFLD